MHKVDQPEMVRQTYRLPLNRTPKVRLRTVKCTHCTQFRLSLRAISLTRHGIRIARVIHGLYIQSFK
jgi:hypothetical protein